MKIDIVLRTCDRGNVHTDWRVRYCQQPKNLLLLGCLRSLVRSCNQLINHIPTITVLDDHSSVKTVNEIKSILSECAFDTKFVALEKRGYNNSCYQQYSYCRDSTADVVYAESMQFSREANRPRHFLLGQKMALSSWSTF